jgi:hypothetical protein
MKKSYKMMTLRKEMMQVFIMDHEKVAVRLRTELAQVLMAASMEMRAFWNTALSSLIMTLMMEAVHTSTDSCWWVVST